MEKVLRRFSPQTPFSYSDSKSPNEHSCVVYWMTRDHRVSHNWTLSAAQQLAREAGVPVRVVFALRKNLKPHLGTDRLVRFMLSGLHEVAQSLDQYGIPFDLVFDEPEKSIPQYAQKTNALAVLTDFFPIKPYTEWQKSIHRMLSCPLYIVDSHNVVPVWEASDKREYAARFLRKKVHALLTDWLHETPQLIKQKPVLSLNEHAFSSVESVLSKLSFDKHILLPTKVRPGSAAAQDTLKTFLAERIQKYADKRNDPNADVLSNLSPYLHFGHISSHEVLKAVESEYDLHNSSIEPYVEEILVRKELSDNYCHYTTDYDSPNGYPDWAVKTLAKHAADPRTHLYTLDQFANAQTHEPLWNAAQNQLRISGKMHGYLRMYWAKKILEWSKSVSDAHQTAIYLNDLYSLDGRDPNGYTGIAWSLGGVHDRPWFERPIFGTIRYMNAAGATKKFSTKEYCATWNTEA